MTFQRLPQDIQLLVFHFLPYRYQCLLVPEFWIRDTCLLISKRHLHEEHKVPVQLFLDYLILDANNSFYVEKEKRENEQIFIRLMMSGCHQQKVQNIHLEISTKWEKHTEKHHHEYWETYIGKIHISFQDDLSINIDHNDFILWYAKNYVDYTLGWQAHDGGYIDY